MNIEQYRAMKAEIAANENKPETNEETKETVVNEEKVDEVPTTETKPKEEPEYLVEIDGQKLTLDDLKNGYLRQSDYTKKTQDINKKRQEIDEAIKKLEVIQSNQPTSPNAIQMQQEDLATKKIIELEEKYYDLVLKQEIADLSKKYDDFDTDEVIGTAYEKKLTNLEDAYLLWKSNKSTVTNSFDEETYKKEIEKSLREQIEKEYKDTRSAVGGKSTKKIINNTTPELTPDEKKVAANMKMSEKEYYQWKVGVKK